MTGVTGIDGIKPELVVAYRDAVYARKLSGKSQSNVFTRLRRYLTFFRYRAIAIDVINKALGYPSPVHSFAMVPTLLQSRRM